MAMVIKTGSGKKRRHRGGGAPMADLNMVPFIDVMLVLLVIFMVAAPLLTTGVPIELPKTGAKELNIDQKPLSISVDERGRVFLQEKEVTLETLVNELQAQAKQGFDERIYVRGAARVEYARVSEVMGVLQKAGFTKIGLVHVPLDGK